MEALSIIAYIEIALLCKFVMVCCQLSQGTSVAISGDGMFIVMGGGASSGIAPFVYNASAGVYQALGIGSVTSSDPFVLGQDWQVSPVSQGNLHNLNMYI